MRMHLPPFVVKNKITIVENKVIVLYYSHIK